MSSRQVAAALRAGGVPAEAVDATGLIVTDRRFQDAAPDMELSRTRAQEVLLPLLKTGTTPVVTGFIGATVEGIPTTLGRGGSDYSGAILAACLDADELWIWTDVPGVMSTDPRIVPEAHTIAVLNYREVAELAYYGAKVLHPKTIRPVLECGIPIRVKSTFDPANLGTLIVGEGGQDQPIKAVTAIRDVALITVEGKGMLGVPGIAARTFSAVAETGTSVLLITQSSSEQSICFMIPQKRVDEVLLALDSELTREIDRRDIDAVWADTDVTIITVVGSGMGKQHGVAGRIFQAVAEAGINVTAIAYGSSHSSISFTVPEGEGENAIRAVHALTRSG
jgi:aspartate kinase